MPAQTHVVAVIGAGNRRPRRRPPHRRRRPLRRRVRQGPRDRRPHGDARRAGDFAFDHGAQFFRARGAAMGAAVERWTKAGAGAAWFGDAQVGISHVGVPGMSAPARRWLRARRPDRRDRQRPRPRRLRLDGGRDAAGPVAHAANRRFAAVVLAVPAPQGVPAGRDGGHPFPGMENARYAPCWALMLGFAARLDAVADRAEPGDGVIGWIARNVRNPDAGAPRASSSTQRRVGPGKTSSGGPRRSPGSSRPRSPPTASTSWPPATWRRIAGATRSSRKRRGRPSCTTRRGSGPAATGASAGAWKPPSTAGTAAGGAVLEALA